MYKLMREFTSVEGEKSVVTAMNENEDAAKMSIIRQTLQRCLDTKKKIPANALPVVDMNMYIKDIVFFIGYSDRLNEEVWSRIGGNKDA